MVNLVNLNILKCYKSFLLLVYIWFTWFTRLIINIILQCKPCKPRKKQFIQLTTNNIQSILHKNRFTCKKTHILLNNCNLHNLCLHGLQGLHSTELTFTTQKIIQ